MKLQRAHLEISAFLVLYLFAFLFWTIPLHENTLPFGDVDASSHFTIGDYMVAHDASTIEVPYYIFLRYGGQNSEFPGYLWYPPQYWTSTGISQILGGDRILPSFLFVAFSSLLIMISSFILVRHLFGFWPALLSSFLLVFSTRDYMIYLWGQWPQSLSFGFTPIVLYCYYRYHETRKKKENPTYLYLLAILLSAQFFFHPQGMVASSAAIILFILYFLIKERKIPFNIKHAAFSFIGFILVSSLFAPFNIGEFVEGVAKKQDASESSTLELHKLFKWYQGIKGDGGLPDFYFTYNLTHGSLQGGLISWWTLPLLLFGITVLFLRRKPKDILFLSWLFSFYLLTHLSVIGLGSRDIRMFAYEAHIFYPLIALGLVTIPTLFQKKLRRPLFIGLTIIFLLFALNVNAKSAFETLKSQQYSAGRINSMQLEAAEWIKENLDERAVIYSYGTLGFQNYGSKVKWMGVLSQRRFATDERDLNITNHIFVDYSDARLLGNQDYANAIQQFEQTIQNGSIIYDKNFIRLYKLPYTLQ